MIVRKNDMLNWTEAEFIPRFHFNEKRRIIQDLYYLGIESNKRELKDLIFFNFNAEIAIKIGADTAMGTHDSNASANQLLIIVCSINHLTRYHKLLGTYTAGAQNE